MPQVIRFSDIYACHVVTVLPHIDNVYPQYWVADENTDTAKPENFQNPIYQKAVNDWIANGTIYGNTIKYTHARAFGTWITGSDNATVNGRGIVRVGDVGCCIPRFLLHGNYQYAGGTFARTVGRTRDKADRWGGDGGHTEDSKPADRYCMNASPTGSDIDRLEKLPLQAYPRASVNSMAVNTIEKECRTISTQHEMAEEMVTFSKQSNLRNALGRVWGWWYFHVFVRQYGFNHGWGQAYPISASENCTFCGPKEDAIPVSGMPPNPAWTIRELFRKWGFL